MKTLLLSLASLALSAPLLAQGAPVQMNARVVAIGAPAFCPSFQFRVEGSNVHLTSSAVDLASLVGETVLLVGTDASSAGCPVPVVSVDAVLPAIATLESCGTAQPGCSLVFRAGPPTISVNTYLASIGDGGFFNLGSPLGVLLLNPPFIDLGSTGPAQNLEVQVPPGAPIGLPITVQAHHLSVGPVVPPGALSNPLRFTLLPQGPLCIDPTSCF